MQRVRAVMLPLLALCLLSLQFTFPKPAAADAVLIGAADIATCGGDKDAATAKLIESIGGEVFAAGDNVYPAGTLANYQNCYDKTWGKFKNRTHPIPGNHDYVGGNANGYFDYFGDRAGTPGKGYYSWDYGGWHIVMLNSNAVRGLQEEQIAWLKADLSAHPNQCIMAFTHHPRFSSGINGLTAYSQGFFKVLYDFGADVLVSGDAHNYERFAQANPRGFADPGRGVRQFVVGTGGAYTTAFGKRWAITEERFVAFGVLKFSLRPGSYSWQFIPIPGSEGSDSGETKCVHS